MRGEEPAVVRGFIDADAAMSGIEGTITFGSGQHGSYIVAAGTLSAKSLLETNFSLLMELSSVTERKRKRNPKQNLQKNGEYGELNAHHHY